MHKQSEKNLLPIIKDVGCFFLSCINMIELNYGIKIVSSRINMLWKQCKYIGCIDNDNKILDSAMVMNELLFFLDIKDRFIEIATKSNNVINYYGYVEKYHKEWKNEKKSYIQKILTEYDTTHFRLVDNNENIIFDTLDNLPKVKKVLYTIVYINK